MPTHLSSCDDYFGYVIDTLCIYVKTMQGFPWQLVICGMLVDCVVSGMLVIFMILAWKTLGVPKEVGYKTIWGFPWRSRLRPCGGSYGTRCKTLEGFQGILISLYV